MRRQPDAFAALPVPPTGAARRRDGRPVDHVARPAAADPARARPDRVHPHRRPAGRAGRRPGRARGPGCPTRCRRWRPARSRRSPPPAGGRRWFQVYVWRDRGLVKDMIERAAAHGYEALVLTVDTAVPRPPRARRAPWVHAAAEARPGHDPRRRRPPGVDVAVRPRRADPLRQRGDAQRRRPARRRATAVALAEYINAAVRPGAVVGRHRVDALGVERPDRAQGDPDRRDAQIAAEHGVDAIALSNHGGRQLDGAPATLDLVAPVAEAVGGRVEIICDGGVRRGSDIVKAVALGADGVHGRAGVPLRARRRPASSASTTCSTWFDADVRRTMALLGVTSHRRDHAEHITPPPLSAAGPRPRLERYCSLHTQRSMPRQRGRGGRLRPMQAHTDVAEALDRLRELAAVRRPDDPVLGRVPRRCTTPSSPRTMSTIARSTTSTPSASPTSTSGGVRRAARRSCGSCRPTASATDGRRPTRSC